MANAPILTVYKMYIKPVDSTVEKTNRWLFRNIISQANVTPLADSFIFMEFFRYLIRAMDAPEMYKDTVNYKSFTAYQENINDSNVGENITIDSGQFIIDGVVEGGSYGRKRKKTSTINKSERTQVLPEDAITSEFYFLLYAPPAYDKIILMIQSYEGDSIDSVMKKFFANFLQYPDQFKEARFERYIPDDIINDFKESSLISNLKFTTEIPTRTLLSDPLIPEEKRFRVSISITPIEADLTVEDFEASRMALNNKTIFEKALSAFSSRRGSLRDSKSGKRSSFQLESNFKIRPVILLSNYIPSLQTNVNFADIKSYCRDLLNDQIKPIVYPEDGIQQR